MILAILSFLAWFFVVVCYLGWCSNRATEQKKKDDVNLGDVVALPGWIFILTLPLTFVGGLLFLLCRVF